MSLDRSDESRYDRTRLRQWARGRARYAGVDRRSLLRLFAAGPWGPPARGRSASVSGRRRPPPCRVS